MNRIELLTEKEGMPQWLKILMPKKRATLGAAEMLSPGEKRELSLITATEPLAKAYKLVAQKLSRPFTAQPETSTRTVESWVDMLFNKEQYVDFILYFIKMKVEIKNEIIRRPRMRNAENAAKLLVLLERLLATSRNIVHSIFSGSDGFENESIARAKEEARQALNQMMELGAI